MMTHLRKCCDKNKFKFIKKNYVILIINFVRIEFLMLYNLTLREYIIGIGSKHYIELFYIAVSTVSI